MKKYLVNGFRFLHTILKRNLNNYEVDFLFPKSSRFDFFTNNLLYKKWQKAGKIKEYDVVHINNWENFFNYKKIPGQVGIGESHGFHVGINFDQTIRELPLAKRISSKIMKVILTKKIVRKIKEFDIYYVSTPNMLEHAKKIRKDAKWLPNPIDTKLFSRKGKKIKLEGTPAVFLPTRLHTFKNPLFAINLFKKIKGKYPKAKLHLIDYGIHAGPLTPEFKLRLRDKETYIWHKVMDQKNLAIMYRSADLVLGQFNPSLATLSLVELESMACGATIVTLDDYELNYRLNDIEKIALKILKDPKFKKKYSERNYNYVIDVHSGKAVAETVLKDIAKVKN